MYRKLIIVGFSSILLLPCIALSSASEYPVLEAPPQHLSTSDMTAKAGRVLILLSHPRSPQKMWAGTAHGGLWHSTDEGNTWQQVGDAMKNLAVSTIAVDPGDLNSMYIGTGEARSNGAAALGQGMFKSEDGGASWKLLPLTSPATVGENWSRISYIAINKAGVILAATSDNKRNGFIYRSTNGGQSWGLFPVYVGSKVGPHNMVHKVSFDPDNPEAAIFMDDYANVTHSSDGGATWSVVRKSSTSCK